MARTEVIRATSITRFGRVEEGLGAERQGLSRRDQRRVLASSECYLRDINCELGRRGNVPREEGLIFRNHGEPRWDGCMTQRWLNVG